MANKFHVNSKGELRPCSANKRACRFSEDNHFNSMSEAEQFIAEKEQNSSLNSFKKKINSVSNEIKNDNRRIGLTRIRDAFIAARFLDDRGLDLIDDYSVNMLETIANGDNINEDMNSFVENLREKEKNLRWFDESMKEEFNEKLSDSEKPLTSKDVEFMEISERKVNDVKELLEIAGNDNFKRLQLREFAPALLNLITYNDAPESNFEKAWDHNVLLAKASLKNG